MTLPGGWELHVVLLPQVLVGAGLVVLLVRERSRRPGVESVSRPALSTMARATRSAGAGA